MRHSGPESIHTLVDGALPEEERVCAGRRRSGTALCPNASNRASAVALRRGRMGSGGTAYGGRRPGYRERQENRASQANTAHPVPSVRSLRLVPASRTAAIHDARTKRRRTVGCGNRLFDRASRPRILSPGRSPAPSDAAEAASLPSGGWKLRASCAPLEGCSTIRLADAQSCRRRAPIGLSSAGDGLS